MKHAQKSNRRVLWWVTAILLLAAWLRLGAFQEALIGSDQSSILAAAIDIASFRDLPVVGIKSSVGVMQTAITPYIAAVPLLFLKRVIAIKWWFSVLDLFAVALLFRSVRRSFGTKIAAIATLLYATNPWVVEYVRWIWYQSLISTFAVTAFSGLLLLFHSKEGKYAHTWITLTFASSALMSMVHLAGVPWAALLMVTALMLAVHRKLWKGLSIGIALSAFIVLPYAVYLFKTKFADLATLLQGNGSESAGLNWASYRLTWELLGGGQIFGTPRSPLWEQSVWSPGWVDAVMPILVIMCVVLSIVLLIRWREKRAALGFTLAWLLLAPTLFVPTSIHLQHFYLMFIFPAPCVILAIIASKASAFPIIRWLQRGGLALLVLVAGYWSYIWTVRITLEQVGELRAPTRAWLMDRTVDVVDGYLSEDPSHQVIVLTAYEGGLSPFDWVRNFVNSDRVRIVSPGSGFIIPTTPTCYLAGPGVGPEMLEPVRSMITQNPAMSVPANPPWMAWCHNGDLYMPGPRATWQNGLALLDADIAGEFAPGGSLNITYRWLYNTSDRAPETYHIFNHLLFEGESMAQVDGTGVPAWYWREGDVLITHFTLALPAEMPDGVYSLITGFYTYPGLERILLESGDGHREVKSWILGPKEPQKITDPTLDVY